MRRALLKELKKLYPSSVNIGQTPTVFPAIILSFGTEIKTVFGRFTLFSATCYADSVDTIDTMHEAVKKTLHNKPIARVSDNTVFYPEYIGTGTDFPNNATKKLSREIQFRVPSFGNDVM